MIVYRFSHRKYAHELSGIGARLKGGRWNPPGISVLYTSASISLALIEVLANANSLEDLKMIQLMEIYIPNKTECQKIRLMNLKKEWYQDFDYTQWLGKEILQSQKTLLCDCPSAIVHKEHNYLINTSHPDFKKIRLLNTTDFYFDERLFTNRMIN